MKHVPAHSLAGAFSAALLVLSLPVAAQDKRTPEQLSEASSKALELATAGKMAEAIVLWDDLLDELEGSALLDTHVNLSVAYERIGRLPESWHHLALYLRESTRQGKSDAAAEKALRKLEEKLGKDHAKVGISCEPDGTLLAVKSQGTQGPASSNQSCPLTWWFKPGKHTVVATRAGYKQKEELLDIPALGAPGVFVVKLEKDAALTGVLEVRGDAKSVQVFIDGRLEGAVPFKRKLKPGTYDLMVGSSGQKPWKKTVTIEAGKTVVEEPDVAKAVAPKPAGPIAPLPTDKPPPGKGPVVTAGPGAGDGLAWGPVLTAGGGALLLAAGGVVQYMGYSKNQDLLDKYPPGTKDYNEFVKNSEGYDEDFESDVAPLLATSYGLYAVGAAAVIGGVVWLLLDSEEGPAPVTLAPMAAPGAVGFIGGGAF